MVLRITPRQISGRYLKSLKIKSGNVVRADGETNGRMKRRQCSSMLVADEGNRKGM